MKKIGIVVAALLTAGCASSDRDPQFVGMPNPASAYCIQIGGNLTIENQTAGQVGICTLPSGERLDEWELYRQKK